MPNDAAPAELDVEQVSTDLASDLISGLGGEPPAPADKLDDAIDSTVDAEAGAETVKPAEDASDASKAAGRDASGRFQPKDKAAASAAAAVDPAAAPGDLPVPKSWAKEMHPIWDKLAKGVPLTTEESRKAATYYNEREKQMLDGLGAYKTDADFGKTIRGTISKHEPLLRQQGIDPQAAVEHLFTAHQQLSVGTPAQRREYLGKIAKQYGIDLAAQTAADPNAPVLPPEVKAALERLDKIEGALTTDQQRRFDEQKTAIANDVVAFADAKDEKGSAKHPYFDECADHICMLLKGDPGMKLEAAYDTAVWANPLTRQKELARLQQERENEAREKAKAAVQKAKKGTSTNVSGRDTQRAPQAPAASVANLDDVMRETQEELKSRAE